MVQSVLGSLTLGYRALWGRSRALAGVQLYVAQADASAAVDTPHLLRTLREMWGEHSPPLLLSPQSRQLLLDLLQYAQPGGPDIEVRGQWLAGSEIFSMVRAAHARGLRLVWRGDLTDLPEQDVARCFSHSLLSLQPEVALAALRAGAQRSPVLPGQMYEGIASRTVMAHCLDQRNALSLAGWPTEDVLYSLRHETPQPGHATIYKLMKAIDAEQSLEIFEDILAEDPLLAYRFMTYTNSAALGLRTGIDSLRRGLVMMGYGSIQRWLGDQLPHASTEPDLQPVYQSMVLRARVTERLLDAGVENELRREIYLCGLFSQLDLLLREPLSNILLRLPLSERIHDAAVLHTGPYAPSLQLACALESDDASAVRQLCEEHELRAEDVNRALLRALADLHVARLQR
ncbi:HDOD domain-containing protein [Simplicispira metamorpha]|jgi:EAL and modified HD-GYP domain-containing signal transduction protein|uniref:HDOD domain-containing protein n=1 Tax=Simplicispira metamorpha TaxID=80881 RepID=A0A4R2N3D2_9BURK|nr:HDOD domain-containing protein [Simplicispira metamorpha]MBP8205247.1 HDOD domain-containing protein [Giesbergeria sp.]TCP14426.1 HDOD domain-containing protein [Simplicispira metamorpha]